MLSVSVIFINVVKLFPSCLFLLAFHVSMAQPCITPVSIDKESFVYADAALIHRIGLRSVTVRQPTSGNYVFAYFEYNARYQPIIEYQESVYTVYSYDQRGRFISRAAHKGVAFEHLEGHHDIDSTVVTYLTDSTAYTVHKEYMLGSERNRRNESYNRKYYNVKYSELRGSLTYVPVLPVYSFPNGNKRLPEPADPCVLDTKFKTDYTDTVLYLVKEIDNTSTYGVNTVSRIQVEPDEAFDPPHVYYNADWCGTSHDIINRLIRNRIQRCNAEHLLSEIAEHAFADYPIEDANARANDANDQTTVLFTFQYVYR